MLGLSWARSLMAMRAALAAAAAAARGAADRRAVAARRDDSSIELVRDVARARGGQAFFFYAPMIVPDAATARALRTQPEIARALAPAPG